MRWWMSSEHMASAETTKSSESNFESFGTFCNLIRAYADPSFFRVTQCGISCACDCCCRCCSRLSMNLMHFRCECELRVLYVPHHKFSFLLVVASVRSKSVVQFLLCTTESTSNPDDIERNNNIKIIRVGQVHVCVWVCAVCERRASCTHACVYSKFHFETWNVQTNK